MTTIAGVVHRGRCYLGGDSAATVDDSVYLQADPKVFQRGPVLIGIIGNSDWEEMLRAFNPPKKTGDARAWLTATLGQHVRRSGTWLDDNEALIGFDGCLWNLEHTGAIWPLAQPFTAHGSGRDPARAVLRFTVLQHVRTRLSLTPEERILAALDAAVACTEGTRAPFHVIHDGPQRKRRA